MLINVLSFRQDSSKGGELFQENEGQNAMIKNIGPEWHDQEHRTKKLLLGQDETKKCEETVSFKHKSTYSHMDLRQSIKNSKQIDEAT